MISLEDGAVEEDASGSGVCAPDVGASDSGRDSSAVEPSSVFSLSFLSFSSSASLLSWIRNE